MLTCIPSISLSFCPFIHQSIKSQQLGRLNNFLPWISSHSKRQTVPVDDLQHQLYDSFGTQVTKDGQTISCRVKPEAETYLWQMDHRALLLNVVISCTNRWKRKTEIWNRIGKWDITAFLPSFPCVCLSVCLSAIRSDEGIMLETSAQNLFTVANLQHQLSWWNQIILSVCLSA